MKRLPGWLLLSSVLHIALVVGVIAACTIHTVPSSPIVIDFSIENTPVIPQQKQTNVVHKKNFKKQNRLTSQQGVQEVVPEKVDTLVVAIDTAKNIDVPVSAVAENPIINVASETSLSDEQLKNVYVSTNFDYIRELVYKGLTYPPIAIENTWEGAVIVSFLVDNNGNIDSVHVLKSSGYRLLDQNAVSAVKHAAPYPKSSSRVEIKLPVIYKVEG